MAAAAAPLPPLDPAVMIDEIVEEFLLRLTPDDPELLARAALVSRQWHRVVTGRSFRRRFREFHRSKPLLGYVHSVGDSVRFVPLSSFRPPGIRRRFVRVVSSSHGRVLLHRLFEKDLVAPRDHRVKPVSVHLSVWHPVTGEQQDLPVVPLRPTRYMDILFRKGCRSNWDAVVVCAAAGDGCDHLRCGFMVIFVGSRKGRNFTCFFSSEVGCWSRPVISSEEVENTFVQGNCVLIGTSLYSMSAASSKIFKYDWRTHQTCNIPITPGFGRLIAAEDGRLGSAEADDSTLRLCVRENGRWEESRVIDLSTLLPPDAIPDQPLSASVIVDTPWVVAFAETGAGVIFLRTCVGFFTIDLKSGSCKKVGNYSPNFTIVPYVSFCTPAPGAGIAISSDEV